MGCGSSFPVRYVSGGSLFLKPLGTFPNMPVFAFFVNRKCPALTRFPQKRELLFLMGYRTGTEDDL
jgi:hypothetical protein